MADNSSRRFKFISPGVFIDEIDNSQVPRTPTEVGPLVMGRAQRGPANIPVTINSFSEFVETFGNAVAGNTATDVWREGDFSAPTYAAFAAQAWLANNGPITFMRVLGDQSSQATDAGKAGWSVPDIAAGHAGNNVGGVYSLVVFPEASQQNVTGSVAAQFYCDKGRVLLSGSATFAGGSGAVVAEATIEVTNAGGVSNGETFTLVDSAGLSTVYTVNSGIDPDDGGGSGGVAVLGYAGIGGGAAGAIAAAAAIRKAINQTTDANYTATDDGVSTVTVRQGTGGTAGNQTNSDAIGGVTVGNFTGGAAGVNGFLFGSTMRKVDNIDSITLVVSGSSPAVDEKVKVSLNPGSENFIRKVMNTNPTITNAAITSQATMTASQGGNLWLGESFERSLTQASTTSIGVLKSPSGTEISAGGAFRAMLLPMSVTHDLTKQQNDWQGAATRASTGWFISQDLSANNAAYYSRNMQRLFRLEAITAGEEIQRQVKVSIDNIKAPEGNFQSYGSFSVLIRAIGDTDQTPQIIERYDNLNLNPASPDYIAARIGDKYQKYDAVNLRNVEYGQFANQSNYVRVVMDDDIAAGVGEARLLPFGVWGPLKYRDVAYASGSAAFRSLIDGATPTSGAVADSVETMLDGGGKIRFGNAGYLPGLTDQGATGPLIACAPANTFNIRFPSVPLRQRSSWGSPRSLNSTFWGGWTGRSASDTFYNDSLPDMLRPRAFDVVDQDNPAAVTFDVEGETTANALTSPVVTSWVFSLDDISGSANSGYTYAAGQRRAGTSVTAGAGKSYKSALDLKLARFTTMLAGGTNGYNIKEREPFRNSAFNAATDEKASYQLFSLRKAINIASDPDYVQMNAVTIPGVWVSQVTDYLLETAEDRGDTLALIDIQYGYTPQSETKETPETANAGNTASAAATALAGRSINNSYGATYYPWVRIFDNTSGQSLWAPPTVAALGVLSTTDRLQAPWFAPAGFTRGGLSEGAAGIPVLDVSQRLTSEERDTLYENNINPIAKFPAEGIVVFGQKTLQQTASALDRINVRRLMIFLKREISFIASRLLFAPNVQDTWDRFIGQATPVLESVKAEFGIEQFRLILDDSTTTPDLIDRNIIYAKLLVKPTRAVEFFAIDFVVTNSGASFAD